MALEIYDAARDGWIPYVTGAKGTGTPLPPRGVIPFRDLAASATVAYASTVVELHDDKVLKAVSLFLGGGTGTISAGNLYCAIGAEGVSNWFVNTVASGHNTLCVPRVSAGVVQSTNLVGWLIGVPAKKFRFSSAGVVLGTGTFDLYGTMAIGPAA